jgi:hypothetical protein
LYPLVYTHAYIITNPGNIYNLIKI